MQWPAPLRAGSRIALVAPARRVQPAELKPFMEFVRWQGWSLVYEPSDLYAEDGFFAGSDAHRLRILQAVLSDPTIQAIWLARGGHGLSRLWPKLEWEGFVRHPKWIIGFSDGTPLLWAAARAGVVALHAPVAAYIPHRTAPEALNRLLAILRGEAIPPLIWSRRPWYAWQVGSAQGQLWGGNLTLLTTLAGTLLDFRHLQTAALLFFEEVGEYYYRLDRLLWHLYNAGWFSQAQAVLVGALSSLIDDQDLPFSRSPKEMILDVLQDLGRPFAMGLPTGHIAENYPLPIGARAHLIIKPDQATLTIEREP